jgi:hypothetical protein
MCERTQARSSLDPAAPPEAGRDLDGPRQCHAEEGEAVAAKIGQIQRDGARRQHESDKSMSERGATSRSRAGVDVGNFNPDGLQSHAGSALFGGRACLCSKYTAQRDCFFLRQVQTTLGKKLV